MAEFEAVIGLEVHAQLQTRTKIFCGCSTAFGAPPNTQVCPVCLGHPGALPVLNEAALLLACRAALALGCTVRETSIFARKNYFYPDLPKGYQISQYDRPLAEGGSVPIEAEDGPRRIGLIRIHMEEDAGKSIHEGMPDSEHWSYVDLNRTGVPLVEIVSEPALRTPEEAYLYLQRLRSVLRYIGVCDGNMEQGSLRCDANVSIRPVGQETLGIRTELKNLNSMRNVQRALTHEIERQIERVRSGGEVEQQTVLWDEAAGITRPMRGKEEAHDYRYFPDPDLPPVVLTADEIEQLRVELPELPDARKARFAIDYPLSDYEAQLLTLERGLADYFEQVAEESGNPKTAANFILNDLLRMQRADEPIPLAAEHLARLIRMVDDGTISNSVARGLFGELHGSGPEGQDPEALVAERGLEQVSDAGELRALAEQVLAEFPDQLRQYRDGKTGLFGFFVGHVMKRSGGKANPKKVNELLREMIARGETG